jgi:plastocyanin
VSPENARINLFTQTDPTKRAANLRWVFAVTAIFMFSNIIISILVDAGLMKSGLIFVYLIIVVTICLSGCLQPTSNSGTQSTPNAPSNLTPSNLTSINSATMNMSAASQPYSKEAIIYLMAKNIAFNKSTITVPAGANVAAYFDNEDSGTHHKFAVYDSPARSQTILQGKIITDKALAMYTFTAPTTPGNYFFRCDVHLAIMTGQFVVEPSGASQQMNASNVSNVSNASSTGMSAMGMQFFHI